MPCLKDQRPLVFVVREYISPEEYIGGAYQRGTRSLEMNAQCCTIVLRHFNFLRIAFTYQYRRNITMHVLYPSYFGLPLWQILDLLTEDYPETRIGYVDGRSRFFKKIFRFGYDYMCKHHPRDTAFHVPPDSFWINST